MILLIDNFDSFTYNLCQYIQELGSEVMALRNDAISVELVNRLRPQLIVLSPGPGGPEATGACLEIIDACHRSVSLLGVCLGMQTLAQYFGGRVVQAVEPVHGKVRPIEHDEQGLFAGLPNPLAVTRYHSLVVDPASLPACLQTTARSEAGEIMALRHQSLPIWGVQFHPEAYLTQGGRDLLRNALKMSRCAPAR